SRRAHLRDRRVGPAAPAHRRADRRSFAGMVARRVQDRVLAGPGDGGRLPHLADARRRRLAATDLERRMGRLPGRTRVVAGGHSGIEVMDRVTKAATAVTAGQIEASHPSWSPDGSTISFVGYPLAGGLPGVYTVRADGTGLRRLTGDADPAFTPAWQPVAASVPTEGSVPPPASRASSASASSSAAPQRHRRHRYQTISSHLIAPGVRFVRLIDHVGPNRIFVVRAAPGRRITMDTALANDRVGGFERVTGT